MASWTRSSGFQPCLLQALEKRGLPRRLYMDNGAVFRSHQLKYACARLGPDFLQRYLARVFPSASCISKRQVQPGSRSLCPSAARRGVGRRSLRGSEESRNAGIRDDRGRRRNSRGPRRTRSTRAVLMQRPDISDAGRIVPDKLARCLQALCRRVSVAGDPDAPRVGGCNLSIDTGVYCVLIVDEALQTRSTGPRGAVTVALDADACGVARLAVSLDAPPNGVATTATPRHGSSAR